MLFSIGMSLSFSVNALEPSVVAINHGVYKALINCSTRLPIVVAFKLSQDNGIEKRYSEFLPDPQLLEINPRCHPLLNHGYRTYQAVATKLYVRERYDIGHLAGSNHLDHNSESIKISNYWTNVAPQSAEMNRKGGAWFATEEITECQRDVEPLIILTGVLADRAKTENDHFTSTFGQPTPEFFWKVIYFQNSKKYKAWLVPNTAEASAQNLNEGKYDIALERLLARIGYDIPELKTMVNRNTPSAEWDFVKTVTTSSGLSCRNITTSLS